MSKPIAPRGRRATGCPKRILVEVQKHPLLDPEEAPGGYELHATAWGLDRHNYGGVQAVAGAGGRRVLQVAAAKVSPVGCGIGTRLYEALAQEACERGLKFSSAQDLSEFSGGFWEKQLAKGRAVRSPHGYLIKKPCEHAQDLSGVKRKKRAR